MISKKIHFFGAKLYSWLENALFLQAICTLVSTPILYLWKMPNSYCSPLGNLLFGPFMSGFILFSGLIFCCSLFSWHPWPLLWGFEKLVKIWLWLLQLGSPKWLFIPNAITLCCWALGGALLFWMWHNNNHANTLKRGLIIWLLIFSGSCAMQQLTTFITPEQTRVLYKNQQKIVAKQAPSGIALIDHGIFGRLESPEKFIVYQLKAFLLEHFNCCQIQSISFPRQSKRYETAAKQCQRLLNCKTIYWQQQKHLKNDKNLKKSRKLNTKT